MNRILAVFTLVLTGCFCLPVYASTINIDLSSVYTGATPTGSAPWLTGTFTYTPGDTSGSLLLASHLNSSDFLQGANGVTGWAFNMSPLANSPISCTAGKCADSVSVEASGLNVGASGAGSFNLGFGWLSGNRFSGGDTATYDLIFASALSSSPFVANSAGYTSIAHIQGIGENGLSSKITDPGTHDVPEPSQFSVLLIGLLCLGLMLYARRAAFAGPRV